jgi:RNA polymerase sigma-70 factor (ECF subfamily)
MDNGRSYIELVRRAQLGDRESIGNLAELARPRLYAYVFRITLRDDIAQDIVQESILEMVRLLDKLDKADRFWPWLRSIAFGKICRHYEQNQRQKTTLEAKLQNGGSPKESPEKISAGLAKLLSDELKQIIFKTMQELKPRYRTVLVMRCYEQMEYAQIAELMSCSEFSVRVLFHRAKRSLQKRLSRRGFGKGFLLPALILFGKITAPTEAAAAQVLITSATLKVGVAAGVVAAAGSKSVVISLKAIAASLVVAGGAVVGTKIPVLWDNYAAPWTDKIIAAIREKSATAQAVPEKCWYYYPQGAAGPVIMRIERHNPQGGNFWWLQNEQANYCFDSNTGAIYIKNNRMWNKDLSVCRLPTDKSGISEFLSVLEGKPEDAEYVAGDEDSLLVTVERSGNGAPAPSQVIHNYNLLDEEFFRYNWPARANVIDTRDSIHKRGWAYVEITGQINGENISGTGRVPLVYAACEEHYPWLRLQIADRLEITDCLGGASVCDAAGKVLGNYPAGTFFEGFARQWMGLHTIDTIRRDAAEKHLRFETKYLPGSAKAQVAVYKESAGQKFQLVYTVDLEADVINNIEFLKTNNRENLKIGELAFSYPERMGQSDVKFAEPREKSYAAVRIEKMEELWLMRLAEKGLP